MLFLLLLSLLLSFLFINCTDRQEISCVNLMTVTYVDAERVPLTLVERLRAQSTVASFSVGLPSIRSRSAEEERAITVSLMKGHQ